MDNPEKLGTQDTERRQTKQSKTYYSYDQFYPFMLIGIFRQTYK